jgi:hypothetical protein
MNCIRALSLTLAFCLAFAISHAQMVDSLPGKLVNFPSRFLNKIQSKTASLQQQLTTQTQKYIARMTRQEARLKKQLAASDSNAAKQLFAGSAQRYQYFSQRLQQDTGSRRMLVSGPYEPYTDSLRGTLAFLQQNPQLLGSSISAAPGPGAVAGVSSIPVVGNISGLSTVSADQAKLQNAVSQLQSLQAKMQVAALLQQYMQQRQAQIQQYLSKYTHLPSGVANTFSGYKAQAAYYQQQVNAYQSMLNDPDKLFQAALTQLNKVPAFSSFMQRHSALSALVPEGSGPVVTSDPAKPGQGLPGRDHVLAGLQKQLGKNGVDAESVAQRSTSSAISQNSSSGGGSGLSKLSALGTLLSGGGAGSSLGSGTIGNGGSTGAGTGSPQLNPQKTQSFLHRLEFGVNLQSTSSTYFFPATTDIGLSLGYKLNDQNRIGIGASYKLGWTGDIHHLQVSSQGASIRSFIDIGISKTWLASGGLEMNYQPPVYTLHMLRELENWEPAGLIGVTKVIPFRSKIVKSTKLQFLWDFLSYYQTPPTQPLIFRLGYSF